MKLRKQVFFPEEESKSVRLINFEPEPTSLTDSVLQPINGRKQFACENPSCSAEC
jgi:hypothetical protein